MTTRPSGSPTSRFQVYACKLYTRRGVTTVDAVFTDNRSFIVSKLEVRGYCNGCGTYTPEGARCPADTGDDNHVHWPFTLWLEGRLEEL